MSSAGRGSWFDRVDQALFNMLYRRSLVYNTCWEDPAVDREALALGADDTVLVITSAGCNVLDYALTGPRRVHAVDANPRQSALLDLKLAGIRALSYDDFFAVFGRGYHPSRDVQALFSSGSVEEQRAIYDARISPRIWGNAMNWLLSRQFTMSLLGVPWPQRREVEAQHDNGVARFVQEALEYVLRQLPLASNYFYSVYVNGAYTPDCCPEYLKQDNFNLLKAGLVDRVVVHTTTVTAFLQSTPEHISTFVLLDHMDWMSCYQPSALAEEWAAILDRATPGARVIFRSAHARPAYIDTITIGSQGPRIRDRLQFNDSLAQTLQLRDRVHTYAGFHIADVPV